LRSICAILAIKSMEVGNYHFTQVPGPKNKYDMDAYMATLFGGEAQDLWCKLGRAKS
jgi:hypothetical protein